MNVNLRIPTENSYRVLAHRKSPSKAKTRCCPIFSCCALSPFAICNLNSQYQQRGPFNRSFLLLSHCSYCIASMEVASPLSFAPTAGSKRGLTTISYSPQLLNTPNRDMELSENESMQHSNKRRRFHNDTTVESLSEHFSSHSPFFAQAKTSIFASSGGTYAGLRFGRVSCVITRHCQMENFAYRVLLRENCHCDLFDAVHVLAFDPPNHHLLFARSYVRTMILISLTRFFLDPFLQLPSDSEQMLQVQSNKTCIASWKNKLP